MLEVIQVGFGVLAICIYGGVKRMAGGGVERFPQSLVPSGV